MQEQARRRSIQRAARQAPRKHKRPAVAKRRKHLRLHLESKRWTCQLLHQSQRHLNLLLLRQRKRKRHLRLLPLLLRDLHRRLEEGKEAQEAVEEVRRDPVLPLISTSLQQAAAASLEEAQATRILVVLVPGKMANRERLGRVISCLSLGRRRREWMGVCLYFRSFHHASFRNHNLPTRIVNIA